MKKQKAFTEERKKLNEKQFKIEKLRITIKQLKKLKADENKIQSYVIELLKL